MRTSQNELRRRRFHERGRQFLCGKSAVRPMRGDGYVNLLNKYGTSQDSTESYGFEREPVIPDTQLTSLYEGNGLFTKIIDTPAEEALKHGFSLNVNNDMLDAFVEDALDDLEWEEKAATAIKWSRLYGGAIIVMLIDDGRGLEEPIDWQHIRSIDELRVYERAIVEPDYSSLYRQDYSGKRIGNRVSKFGQPEFYYVSSVYGSFTVHESRCLVFRNGVLPEQSTNAVYRFWGMPEYVRIRRALRETITAHTDATKMLERSVQAIYSMKNLAQLLATDDGENQVLKRLEIIDMARNFLNSIAIDSEGESYDFKIAQFSGVKDVIDSTCNMLSALTNIPQTILFGRSPVGMNATGDSDFESYYNYVERIQKLMLKRNLRDLLDVVFRAGIASGEIEEEPFYKMKFNPLWSLSETEQVAIDQTKAQTAQIKAQTTQIYVDMQALDPSEVRTALAADEEYNVEDIIDENDEELSELLPDNQTNVIHALEAAEKNTAETKTPGSSLQSSPAEPKVFTQGDFDAYKKDDDSAMPTGVGVLVVADGKVLCGTRHGEGTICGPGGHIESDETPEQAAVRESQEEFGITPTELIPVTIMTGMPEKYGVSQVYLCTEFDGQVVSDNDEIINPRWLPMREAANLAEIASGRLFSPFALSLSALFDELSQEGISFSHLSNAGKTAIIKEKDGGPGSRRYPKGSGQKQPSANGANEPCTGFSSKAKLKDHAERHGKREMGFQSEQEYQQKAIDFLKQPCGGDIVGYATPSGKVVRFNKKTTEYASGIPGGALKTYMKAKCRKDGTPDPEKASVYYEKFKERDGC